MSHREDCAQPIQIDVGPANIVMARHRQFSDFA